MAITGVKAAVTDLVRSGYLSNDDGIIDVDDYLLDDNGVGLSVPRSGVYAIPLSLPTKLSRYGTLPSISCF